MKPWYESELLVGSYVGAIVASLTGLKWYFTLVVWPFVFFALDFALLQIEKKKLEKEKQA